MVTLRSVYMVEHVITSLARRNPTCPIPALEGCGVGRWSHDYDMQHHAGARHPWSLSTSHKSSGLLYTPKGHFLGHFFFGFLSSSVDLRRFTFWEVERVAPYMKRYPSHAEELPQEIIGLLKGTSAGYDFP